MERNNTKRILKSEFRIQNAVLAIFGMKLYIPWIHVHFCALLSYIQNLKLTIQNNQYYLAAF